MADLNNNPKAFQCNAHYRSATFISTTACHAHQSAALGFPFILTGTLLLQIITSFLIPISFLLSCYYETYFLWMLHIKSHETAGLRSLGWWKAFIVKPCCRK